DKARIAVTGPQGGNDATDHGHQRVHGNETRDGLERLRAHHIEAEPANAQEPGAHRQPGDAGWGNTGGALALRAAEARPQDEDGRNPNPTADRVHDDRAGKIVEFLAQKILEEGLLQPEILIPDKPFEKRIKQADDQAGSDALRQEARALGDAAGDDGWGGGRERQQEEEFDESVALRVEALAAPAQPFGADKEGGAVGNGKAQEEIGDRG